MNDWPTAVHKLLTMHIFILNLSASLIISTNCILHTATADETLQILLPVYMYIYYFVNETYINQEIKLQSIELTKYM